MNNTHINPSRGRTDLVRAAALCRYHAMVCFECGAVERNTRRQLRADAHRHLDLALPGMDQAEPLVGLSRLTLQVQAIQARRSGWS
jgi:hypothetical protein